jgi:preprotein translocase subunit SecD
LFSHINLYKRGLFRLCVATMDLASCRFNLILLLTALVLGCSGCQTGKSKKVETTIRIHAEAKADDGFTQKVKIFKDESVLMQVHQMPMTSDVDIVDAKVVETLGGFAIQLKLNAMGRWQFDHYTAMNIGRHYAIFALWGKKPSISRWIAAPIISNRISDGIILFTPDATREEAEAIVLGLPHEDPTKKEASKEAF